MFDEQHEDSHGECAAEIHRLEAEVERLTARRHQRSARRMKMEQREIDNMLLSMIQKHFPSLPLSDEYTDWGKWLGFTRAVYEAGRASPASVPEGAFKAWWNSDTESADNPYSEESSIYWAWEGWCADLAAAPTPPAEDRKDAERYHKLVKYLIGDRTDLDDAIVAAASKDEMSAILDAMQEDKP